MVGVCKGMERGGRKHSEGHVRGETSAYGFSLIRSRPFKISLAFFAIFALSAIAFFALAKIAPEKTR